MKILKENKYKIISITVIILIGIFIVLNKNSFFQFSKEIAIVSQKETTKKNIEQTSQQETTENIKSIQSNYFIGLVDNYLDTNALKKLSTIEAIKNLKTFNQELNFNFAFYELSFQSFQSLFYYELEDKFVRKYNRQNGVIKNQEIIIENQKCYVTSLNTIHVNQKVYEEFLNYIIKGKGFSQENFIYTNNNKIPIILGYDYLEYYDIGDTIELNYLLKNIEFEIIGFFDKNVNLTINQKNYLLDTYICSPFFEIEEISTNDEDIEFQMLYYLDKNSGYIKCNTLKQEEINIEIYRSKIKELSQKNKLDYDTLIVTTRIE